MCWKYIKGKDNVPAHKKPCTQFRSPRGKDSFSPSSRFSMSQDTPLNSGISVTRMDASPPVCYDIAVSPVRVQSPAQPQSPRTSSSGSPALDQPYSDTRQHGVPSGYPKVLKALGECEMDVCLGVDMHHARDGSSGTILTISDKNMGTVAVKLFKYTKDTEKAFLGVELDPVRQVHVLNTRTQYRRQYTLYMAGFVPSVLRQEGVTCSVCNCLVNKCMDMLISRPTTTTRKKHQQVVDRARELLNQDTHYHVYMTLMHGDLHRLMQRTFFNLEKRLEIFLDVLGIVTRLAEQNILNPDLKAENVLYMETAGVYTYALCDVGGLCVPDKASSMEYAPTTCTRNEGETKTLDPSRDDGVRGKENRTGISTDVGNQYGDQCEEDRVSRFLLIDTQTQTRVFVDKRRADRTMKDTVLSKRTSCRRVSWSAATYVNIYLRAQGIQDFGDLSEKTHLTNQFSVLAFFMYMVWITPPMYTMVEDRDMYLAMMRDYPTIDAYLEHHTSSRLTAHPLGKPILDFIVRTWEACSDWELVGTEKTYLKTIADNVEKLLDISQHAPAPRKVLRHSELETD